VENLSLLLIQSGGGFFGPLMGGSDGAAAAVHGKGAYGRKGAEPGRQECSRHSWSSASRRWSTSETFSETERCTFQPRACAVAGRRVVALRGIRAGHTGGRTVIGKEAGYTIPQDKESFTPLDADPTDLDLEILPASSPCAVAREKNGANHPAARAHVERGLSDHKFLIPL
jgi:hypothetical protein